MSITGLSERVTDLALSSTTSNLGPGRYNLASDPAAADFPPFQQHAVKELNPNTTTSAITPGPGAYVELPFAARPESPVFPFKSSGPRTASIVPHSSEFQEWKGAHNPGPGAYEPPQSEFVSAPRPLSRKVSTRPEVSTPPSIPTRALAYGYEVKSKKLTPYEAPDAALRSTGLPGDTIGPGTYSADKGYAAVTERKLSAVQFDKQAPRKTFRTFSDTVPGPGRYNVADKPAPIIRSRQHSSGLGESTSLSVSASLQDEVSHLVSPILPHAAASITPYDLKQFPRLRAVPAGNLPPSDSTSKLVAVPEASSFLGPRSVGVRPWSKPDFYFRSQVRESATFSSSSPGPGEVYSIEQAPGSQTGRVTHGVTSLQKTGALATTSSRSLSSPTTGFGLAEPLMNTSSMLSGVSAPVSIRSTEVLVLRAATPGPGAYDQPPKHAGSVLNATAVDGLDFEFGTRGSRESGWERRSLVTPFVDTAALQVPGPGTYDPMGSSVLKVEGSGATILRVIDGKLQHVDNKLSAPFSTSVQRDCLTMVSPTEPRGPGEYDLSALSMSASVDRSGLHSRGTSGMASTSKRAEMAMPVLYEQNIFGDDSVRLFDSPSAVNQSNPNPATVDLHRVNQRKPVSRKGLSSFASASNRSELASKAVPEEVAPGSYNIAGNLAPRAAQPVQYHKYRSNIKSMTALIQPRQPFVGTQRRFIKPVPLDVPGPGAYEPAATLPKSSSTKSLPAESRFQPGIGDYIGHKSTLMAAAKVGPGTYVVESSMLKKSHNVNFRPKT